MKAMRWLCLVVSFIATLGLVGCPSKDKTEVKAPESEPAMTDAFALLPGSAIGAGTLDARAFFGSQTFGADLAKLVERYLPLGPESGFQASRDVDRVTFASYSYQGFDVAAVVVGRFDVAKIKQAAATQAPLKTGGTLVTSQYAGRDVHTVSNVGFTLLSNTRAIAGTEQGIRRVLDRIRDRRIHRDMAPWMIQTLETPGAALAVAADFAAQPIPPEVQRQIPGAFVTDLKATRVFATFGSGLQLAASATYADPRSAENAADALRKSMSYVKLLGAFGIRVQNVDIKVDKSDVQASMLIDDQSLRALLVTVPSMVGQ